MSVWHKTTFFKEKDDSTVGAQIPNMPVFLSYVNLVTFIGDGTRRQKCYQIKWRNTSSEYNSYHMKPKPISLLAFLFHYHKMFVFPWLTILSVLSLFLWWSQAKFPDELQDKCWFIWNVRQFYWQNKLGVKLTNAILLNSVYVYVDPPFKNGTIQNRTYKTSEFRMCSVFEPPLYC